MVWPYWLHHAYNLARVIPTIYDGWSRCLPTELGVLVLYPPGSFCIRVTAAAEDPAEGKLPGLPPPFPVYAFGYTGDITSATRNALLDKGISQPMFLALLHTVVQLPCGLQGEIKSRPYPFCRARSLKTGMGLDIQPWPAFLTRKCP